MNPQHRKSTVAQFILLALSLALCVVGVASSTAQSTQDDAATSAAEERELEDKIPKHLPIKVKIKKEKEKAFKDMKNEKWLRDFELEVTNIGDKPIYFLDFILTLPGIKAPDENDIGFPLRYGNIRLGSIENKAEPDDIPINPGETYVLKPYDSNALGWETFRRNKNKPQPKKLLLRFRILSFGDGTGFWRTDGVPVSHAPKEKSSLVSCVEQSNKSDARAFEGQHAPRDSRAATLSMDILPASLLPGNFLSSESSKPVSFKLNPQSQLCCTGSQCWRAKSYIESSCYNCPPVVQLTEASCSDPSGNCVVSDYNTFVCTIPENGVEFYCTETIPIPCGGPTPTPTPYPTPTPIPTPTPTPTPCPSLNCTDPNAAFAASACEVVPGTNSGCPLGYTQNGNCCYEAACPSPTPLPPPCDGTLQWQPAPVCDWLCLPRAPTEPVYYEEPYCVAYFLVTDYWVSYDGGETWSYLDTTWEYIGYSCSSY